MSEIHRDSMSGVNLELETDRLFLRPLVENDWDMALETFMDPEVMKFVADVSSEEALAEEMKVLIRRGAGGRIGVWCVLQRETGEKLGISILLPLPIEEDDTDWSLVQEDRYPDADIEVGYILKRSAWGNGYATEALTCPPEIGPACIFGFCFGSSEEQANGQETPHGRADHREASNRGDRAGEGAWYGRGRS